MYVGPTSSAEGSSGWSGCSRADHWGDHMSDDDSNQSDIPSTPFCSTGDSTSQSPCTQFPAGLTGAVEGSCPDPPVALESARTQIFVWGEQHSVWGFPDPNWSLAASSNKIHPQCCWHQGSHLEFQRVPEVWSRSHSAAVVPFGCSRCSETRGSCARSFLWER